MHAESAAAAIRPSEPDVYLELEHFPSPRSSRRGIRLAASADPHPFDHRAETTFVRHHRQQIDRTDPTAAVSLTREHQAHARPSLRTHLREPRDVVEIHRAG